MSENIIIQEGGVGKNLNAIKKIQTAEQGGGSVYWIPEEEIELGTKTITKNGLYKASKSGVDGWSQVLVNVPGGESKTDSDGNLTDEDGNKARVDSDGNPTSDGSGTTVRPKPSDNGGDGTGVTGTNGVSGINPNDGNEYHVTKNPNTGELIYTKIPSSIRVTKNPDKIIYQDRETINPSGIIVHGYFGDGTDYGTILNSDLRFEPMVADTSKTSEASATSSLIDFTFTYSPCPLVWMWHGEPEEETHGKYVAVFKANATQSTEGYKFFIFSSDEPFDGGNEIVFDGKTCYASAFNTFGPVQNPVNEPNANWDNWAQIAWTMIHGNITGGGQPITVKWNRPADQKELTDTFNIEVGLSVGTDSGGGGSHGF